jgi:hypothetical protein
MKTIRDQIPEQPEQAPDPHRGAPLGVESAWPTVMMDLGGEIFHESLRGTLG